jgi:hypothetical protein
MSSPELIEPHRAVLRLADEWTISHSAAREIVKGVLRGKKCLVIGSSRLGEPPHDISEKIADALATTYVPSIALIPWGFADVKMDWNGLIEHGRKLLPAIYEPIVAAAEARTADGQDRPTLAAEIKMRDWLLQQVNDPPARKDDVLAEARAGRLIGKVGKRLGRNSFDRAWDEHAPDAWKKPGKRKKVLQPSEMKPL